MSTPFSLTSHSGSPAPLTTPEAVLSALDDLSLQTAEIKCQLQSFERDLSLLTVSLENTKGALNTVTSGLERVRLHSAEQFESLSAGKKAEDEIREAVTSSFSDMFHALNKVFSTAQKLGVAPQVLPGALPPQPVQASVQTVTSAPVPVVETSVAEEPDLEETVVETPDVSEPVAEVPVVEEPIAEELVAGEPDLEEPVAATPDAGEPVAEIPVDEEPTIEEPDLEETVVEIPSDGEPVAEVPIVEETEDDEEYEDIEGDPTAVADLLAGVSSSFSTDLPGLPKSEASDIDENDMAELEKLLDGK